LQKKEGSAFIALPPESGGDTVFTAYPWRPAAGQPAWTSYSPPIDQDIGFLKLLEYTLASTNAERAFLRRFSFGLLLFFILLLLSISKDRADFSTRFRRVPFFQPLEEIYCCGFCTLILMIVNPVFIKFMLENLPCDFC
jgi:hypothetical protein